MQGWALPTEQMMRGVELSMGRMEMALEEGACLQVLGLLCCDVSHGESRAPSVLLDSRPSTVS